MSASAELARRQRVRGSMIEWARLNNLEPALHHRLLCSKLEAVARGEIRKFLFVLPPGAGKTIYCNLWVPWYMARSPGKAVLGASHTTELAERFSRRIRGMVQEHSSTLGIKLSDDSQSAGHWALANGAGDYAASGVGSAILGLRIDALLIDDPIRSRDDAFSPTIRENIWEWFHSSARTRLRPGAVQILVMTRFHEDDLAARLLQREDDWHVVHLPAEAQADDPLAAHVVRCCGIGTKIPIRGGPWETKRTQLPSVWSALFQGFPAPESGDYFKAGWFKPMTATPARDRLSIYGASDYAVSAGKGDFTVHVIVGLDPDGTLYLLDLYRAQSDTATSVDAFLDMVKLWKPIGFAQEAGQINSSIGPFMRERMKQREIFVRPRPSRRRATRPCARNPSEDGSRSLACSCHRRRTGGPMCAQNFYHSRRRATTTSQTPWG